jgi:hypothetical protein
MAKKQMLCPFSKELCRECPLYKGRHYYLCFSSRYRGQIENSDGPDKKKFKKSVIGGLKDFKSFKMPPELKPGPGWLVLNEFVEREGREGRK